MARDNTSRGLRDEANVGPTPRDARELKRLSELRYQVADGEPDIRGWVVYSSTGRELGTVDDLLVDVDAGEVVMLDVDLKRDDRHTFAPIRSSWVDHAARRVVVDARELEDDGLPGLPRRGTVSDDEMDRFSDRYARTWGDRAVDQDRDYRVRRDDEELRFGRGRGTGGALGAGAAGAAGAAAGGMAARPHDRHDEPWDGSQTVRADRDTLRDAPQGADRVGTPPAEREPRRLMDTSGPTALPTPQPPLAEGAYLDESRRIDATMAGADDARALPDDRALDPRELDGRVRIDEGATVDDRTPVGGVRYEGDDAPSRGYGRPDERYGAEYGSGRIGFDRVVSRRPWHDASHDAHATTRDTTRDLTRDPAHGDPHVIARDADRTHDHEAGVLGRPRDSADDLRAVDRDMMGHDPADRDAARRTLGERDLTDRGPAERDATDRGLTDRSLTDRDTPGRDPRDRDGDGHVSLGERLRGLGDDAKRSVRYRRYDDRFEGR